MCNMSCWTWNGSPRPAKELGGTGYLRENHSTWLGKFDDSWRTEETCCHADFNEKQSISAGVKKMLGPLMRHKILWDFEIQSWPDLVIVNKKKRTCRKVDFVIQDVHGVKLKDSKKTKDLLENRKKYGTWKWLGYHLWLERLVYSPNVGTETGGLGYYPKYRIVEIDQNT